MIKRLPKWAEVAIELQCIAAGAVAHPPEDDQNGWDYLVEFPPESHPGPADTHPPAKSAYVQVKSKTKGKPACRITLSNALKAAQSMQPWFLVLVVAENDKSKPAIYVIHLWEDFMRRALMAVRQSENEGKPLNRSDLSFTLSDADRHDDDLVSWIHSTIAAHDPDYLQQKQKLYREVGYEDGAFVGNFTISTPNLDEVANTFLGLGGGLAISEFSVAQTRFGIKSPPHIDYSGEGKIFITPNPADVCEVRLRANNLAYNLKGEVFALGEPIVPKDERRFRFSAEFFELITITGAEFKNFNARLDIDSKKTLHTLEAYAALSDWFKNGMPVDLQIWARGQRVMAGTMSVEPSGSGVNWGKFAEIIRKLRGALGSHEDSVKVSVNDIIKAGNRVATFAQTTNAPSMRLEFELTEEAPLKIDCMVLYSFVEVGEYLFFALCDCEFVKEATVEGRRQLDFGPVKLIDSYVIPSPTPKHREQMEKDYQRYLETRGQQANPIAIGEVWTFSQSMKGQSEAP